MARPEPLPLPSLGVAERRISTPLCPDVMESDLLEGYRRYLLIVAERELHPRLRAKVGPSDIVQETFLRAHRDLPRFRGASDAELQAWLRRILLNHIADVTRNYCDTDKRAVRREVSMGAMSRFGRLASDTPSPSAEIMRDEEKVALSDCLNRLSPDYRTVIQLRNYDLLSFEQIGQRLQRSAEAARKLWVRAIERLVELQGMSDVSP